MNVDLEEAERRAVGSVVDEFGFEEDFSLLEDVAYARHGGYEDHDVLEEDLGRANRVYSNLRDLSAGLYESLGVDPEKVVEGAKQTAEEIEDEVLREAYTQYAENVRELMEL